MRLLLVVIVCVFLGACAANPTQVNLVPSGVVRSPQPLSMELKTVTVVVADKAAQTGKVMVDATFPPLWRDSIQTSVDQAGLFKDDATQKATIATTIKKFEFNAFGFTNTVDVDATYSLVDRSNGEKLLEKNIVTSASAGTGDTFNAQERLINLWNKATQENIAKFIFVLQERADNVAKLQKQSASP